jgi:threonine aldolase
MGGGLRQAGILAAAGLISLKEMRLRLDGDHENAKLLASKLSALSGIAVAFEPQINMVYFTFEDRTIDTEAFVSYMAEQGILINGAPIGMPVRLVTHHWIAREHIDRTIAAVAEFLK